MTRTRTTILTLAAVAAGDATRRLVLWLLAGHPVGAGTLAAFLVAGLQGLLAGLLLALARRRSLAARVAGALTAASLAKAVEVAWQVRAGADLGLVLARPALPFEVLVDHVGLVALVGVERRTVAYALFGASRLGPARPDVLFLVDVLAALETFQLLRRLRPGEEASDRVDREAP